MNVSDLSPDVLAKLEAKLVADLEIVRRVRALVEEHRGVLSAGLPAMAGLPAVPAPVMPVESAAPVAARPARPVEEVLLECLIAMGERPFAPQDLREAARKAHGQAPGDKTVKTFFSRMIRQGKVVVHEFRKGRAGCLYRSLLPPPEVLEKPPVAANPPADAGEGADEASGSSAG